MSRYFLKCQTCKKPWAVDLVSANPLHVGPGHMPPGLSVQDQQRHHLAAHCAANRRRLWEERMLRELQTAACHMCGAAMDPARPHQRVHRVMGRVVIKRLMNLAHRCPCDGRCTGATGPSCECSCGGENHGTGRLVEVLIDAGGVPRVNMAAIRRIGDEAQAQGIH